MFQKVSRHIHKQRNTVWFLSPLMSAASKMSSSPATALASTSSNVVVVSNRIRQRQQQQPMNADDDEDADETDAVTTSAAAATNRSSRYTQQQQQTPTVQVLHIHEDRNGARRRNGNPAPSSSEIIADGIRLGKCVYHKCRETIYRKTGPPDGEGFGYYACSNDCVGGEYIHDTCAEAYARENCTKHQITHLCRQCGNELTIDIEAVAARNVCRWFMGWPWWILSRVLPFIMLCGVATKLLLFALTVFGQRPVNRWLNPEIDRHIGVRWSDAFRYNFSAPLSSQRVSAGIFTCLTVAFGPSISVFGYQTPRIPLLLPNSVNFMIGFRTAIWCTLIVGAVWCAVKLCIIANRWRKTRRGTVRKSVRSVQKIAFRRSK